MQQDQILGGRYRLAGQLGVGGMSVVWKAHDELLNRHVAVKVLAGPNAASPAARRRVQAEAQAAAQLSHPNVTSVYDYGEAPGESGDPVPYVVMELLPGRTLSQRLAAGPLPPQAALRICAEVAGALAAAHERHVVHRDVKPGNVMLTPSGAKVLDFGLAAVAGQPDLDEEGQLLGTAAYLAPERLTGDEVLPASDVYALGLLIDRALTGTLPWQADTPSQMLNAHVYVEPDPLPPTDGVPAAVNTIRDRCLAKDPADRPSAADVAAVLTAAAGIVPRPSDDDLPLRTPGAAAVALPGTGSPAGPASDAVHPEPAGPGADSDGPQGATPTQDPPSGTAAGRRRRSTVAVLACAAAVAAVAVAVGLNQAGTEPPAGSAAAAPNNLTASPVPGASNAPAVRPTPASNTTQTPENPTGTGAADSGVPTGSVAPAEPAAPTSAGTNPEPTAGTSAPPTPGPGVQVRSLGGVLVVSCTGDQARILRVDAADGYTVSEYRPGPAGEVKAVLASSANTSEMKVKCSSGAPVPTVKEKPAKP